MNRLNNELYNKLNEYYGTITKYPNLYYNNMGLFFRIAIYMKNSFNEEEFDLDEIRKLDYISILDNIELVKEFYKKYNIKLNIDKLIDNGTINFVENSKGYIGGGYTYNEKNKPMIDILINNNIVDSIILVHELSHYKDMLCGKRTQVRDLFTEGLAYLEEKIFLDFLEEKGYIGIKNIWNSFLNSLIKDVSNKTYNNLKIYLLFKEFGKIDEESYRYFYSNNFYDYTSNYDEIIKRFNPNYKLSECCWDIFGFFICFYLYNKYKKGEITMNDINRYHSSINKGLNTGLVDLGLEDIMYDNIEGIINSVEEEKSLVK